MSSRPELRYEKRRAEAVVTLLGGETVRGWFFVAAGSLLHAGAERVGDLLNAETGFFPFEIARRRGGRTVLYNRPHVVMVRVPTTRRAATPAMPSRPRASVPLLLSNGQRIVGAVRVYRPEGRDRLSDWARQPGDLPLHRNRRRRRSRQRGAHRRRQRGTRIVSRHAPPIDRLFQRDGAAAGASDLHLCVGSPPLVRKDGRMQPLDPARRAADRRRARASCSTPIMPEKNRKDSTSGTTPTSRTRSPGWRASARTCSRIARGPARCSASSRRRS